MLLFERFSFGELFIPPLTAVTASLDGDGKLSYLHNDGVDDDLVVDVAGTDNDQSVGWEPGQCLYESPSQ